MNKRIVRPVTQSQGHAIKRQLKTSDEHIEFICDAAKLMLCFCWKWAQKHPNEEFVDILNKRTLISTYTGLKDKEFLKSRVRLEDKWQQIACQITGIYNTCTNQTNEQDFECRAFEVLQSLLEEYSEKGYRDDIAPLGLSAGSLMYSPKAVIEEHPKWCVFHIANAMYPESIFDEPSHLPGCFEKLMDQSEQECGYDTLYTLTWLNSRQEWLDYFPEEWLENLSKPNEDVWGNLGCWGQIITAKKTLNHKAGGYIRRTGELKYKPLKSHCSFKAMREFLKNGKVTGVRN